MIAHSITNITVQTSNKKQYHEFARSAYTGIFVTPLRFDEGCPTFKHVSLHLLIVSNPEYTDENSLTTGNAPARQSMMATFYPYNVTPALFYQCCHLLF